MATYISYQSKKPVQGCRRSPTAAQLFTRTQLATWLGGHVMSDSGKQDVLGFAEVGQVLDITGSQLADR